MFGFAGATTSLTANDSVALSASQSKADIHAGTNVGTVDATLTSVTLQNGGVDNSQFAVAGATPGRLIHTPTTEGGFDAASDQIKTSIQPVFIKSTDVELQQTKGISHTVFTHTQFLCLVLITVRFRFLSLVTFFIALLTRPQAAMISIIGF